MKSKEKKEFKRGADKLDEDEEEEESSPQDGVFSSSLANVAGHESHRVPDDERIKLQMKGVKLIAYTLALCFILLLIILFLIKITETEIKSPPTGKGVPIKPVSPQAPIPSVQTPQSNTAATTQSTTQQQQGAQVIQTKPAARPMVTNLGQHTPYGEHIGHQNKTFEYATLGMETPGTTFNFSIVSNEDKFKFEAAMDEVFKPYNVATITHRTPTASLSVTET